MDLEALQQNASFCMLVDEVRAALDGIQATTPDLDAALEAERTKLESQCLGWTMSLSLTDIPMGVRQTLVKQIAEAQQRIGQISMELTSRMDRLRHCESLLDPGTVLECLKQLGTVLASQNASAVNVVLSQHIEGIHCDKSGKVVVRTCRLGALSGALDVLPRTATFPNVDTGADSQRTVPRRRARMDVAGAIEDDEIAEAANDFAVDPDRFHGLDESWFREDVFQVPKKRSWAALHAAEVAAYRLETHHSMDRTAEQFGKTVPTIRDALRYAMNELGIDALGKAVSRPSLPNWAREHAQEVAAFLATGQLLKEAVGHFGKSEPTLRKALGYAKGTEPQAEPAA